MIGATFFIMSFEAGRVFQDRPTLSHLPPTERREAMMDFVRSMAKLHKADPVKIGLYGVKGYNKMGEGYPRQMATWLRSETAYLAAMKRWNDPTAKEWEIKGHDKIVEWMNKNMVKDEVAVMVCCRNGFWTTLRLVPTDSCLSLSLDSKARRPRPPQRHLPPHPAQTPRHRRLGKLHHRPPALGPGHHHRKLLQAQL